MKLPSLGTPVLLGLLACAAVTAAPCNALAATEAKAEGRAPHEPHHRLDTSSPGHAHDVALTLDACGGAYDADLIATLVRLQVPATIFVTRRWLDANPAALRELLAHPTLFEMENHGSAHVPAVVGGSVYGMPGARDAAGVEGRSRAARRRSPGPRAARPRGTAARARSTASKASRPSRGSVTASPGSA